MNSGLHLLSCFLPDNPFVDGFIRELHGALGTLGQRLILLPTYQPSAEGPPYVQIAYDLQGYRDLTRGNEGGDFGIVPRAMWDVDAVWTGSTPDGAAPSALDACGRFYGQLLDQIEPDTVCVWNPTVASGRLLQLACLARSIPVYGVERGVFAETMMIEAREVSAQSDLVLNTAMRSLLAVCPYQPEVMDGIANHYRQRDFSRYQGAERLGRDRLRTDLGIAADVPVVVLLLSAAAANWLPRSLPGARFSSPWFDSAEQTVRSLAAALPEDAVLIVQAHPIDRDRWSPPDLPRVRFVNGQHLQSLFDVSDALAFLGATTAQHEALLHDKPVILLSRSQLSGQGVAYEFKGGDLQALVRSALANVDRQQHAQAKTRYVPALFEHALFGLDGSPCRHRPVDLARHLAGLVSAHDTDVDRRIERWIEMAAQDMALAGAAASTHGAPP